jgi:hypothetical protein
MLYLSVPKEVAFLTCSILLTCYILNSLIQGSVLWFCVAIKFIFLLCTAAVYFSVVYDIYSFRLYWACDRGRSMV